MMEQVNPIQLAADEQQRLSRELRELPADAWSAPSRCEGWSNARVLAHLSVVSLLQHQCVTGALNGKVAPPAGPEGRELKVEEFRQALTKQQEELARQSPEDLLALFDKQSRELTELYRSLSLADWDKPAWHPNGIRTIGWFVAVRSFELGFHGWEIRASLDPNAVIRPELRPFLVGFVRQAQLRLCRPDPELAGTCRFEVDGQTWTSRVGNGVLKDAPADAAADASVKTNANTYLLLITSRKSLAELSARITFDGDRRRAERLLTAACFRV